MSLRKPIVQVGGRFQQLQAADTLDATIAEVDVITLTADQALVPGNIVYPTTADHVDKAKADAVGTAKAIGLAKAAISGSGSGVIQTNGVLALTTGQWDTAFGTTGGLTVGTRYYLSAGTAGLGTATAPSTVGQYVQEIGMALSTTELMIDIQPEILL